MLNRLITGWNFIRIIYVVIGVSLIGQFSSQAQWLGVLLGVYISAMGLFGFGCASGNCSDGNCEVSEVDKMSQKK